MGSEAWFGEVARALGEEMARRGIALVYGGGTGIGLACAMALAEEGARVFISGRREAVLKDAVQQIKDQAGAGYAAGDAAVVADVERVTSAAAKHMGGIDTIVISAGAGGPTSIFDTSPEEFQRIMDQNVRPVFLATRLGIDHTLSNVLEIQDGRLTGRLIGDIVDAQAKAARFAELAARYRDADGIAVAIGDGANDLPMLGAADVSIAYRAKPRVRAAAMHAIDHCGLDAVLNLFVVEDG